MSRKESINKMRELLVTRRNALRKALAGDLSLLSQLREQTGGDIVATGHNYSLQSSGRKMDGGLVALSRKRLVY